MNAQEAIDRSISHDEITWADDTPENRAYLTDACDDKTKCNNILEYWANGDSDTDMEWRVHIRVDEADHASR